MGADANRAAAADRSPPTAKSGRLSERAWTDILRGARLARAEGVELLMHGVKITGTRKPSPVKMASCKGLQQPVEPAVPKPPLAKADDASPPPLSKREERSARRLQVFQQKKRAEIFAARYGGSTSGKSADRHEQIYQRKGWHPALARAKLRAMLWRAWARYRPIYGGVVLGYTSLREQHVYRQASRLYQAAFTLDPSKSGSALAAWLGHATPMEEDFVGSQQPPSPRQRGIGAKKPRVG